MAPGKGRLFLGPQRFAVQVQTCAPLQPLLPNTLSAPEAVSCQGKSSCVLPGDCHPLTPQSRPDRAELSTRFGSGAHWLQRRLHMAGDLWGSECGVPSPTWSFNSLRTCLPSDKPVQREPKHGNLPSQLSFPSVQPEALHGIPLEKRFLGSSRPASANGWPLRCGNHGTESSRLRGFLGSRGGCSRHSCVGPPSDPRVPQC